MHASAGRKPVNDMVATGGEMGRWRSKLVILLGGLASIAVGCGDAGTGLPTESDSGATADFSVHPTDLAAAGDSAATRDLWASSGDLASVPDLASAPDLVHAVDLAHPVDLLMACVSACDHCQFGCCQGGVNGCCNQGEWCDNGQCRCGNSPACAQGMMCAAPVFGPGMCGFICCGNGVPCPK